MNVKMSHVDMPIQVHLEYYVSFGGMYLKNELEKLEKIKREVTQMINRLSCELYEKRQKE